MRRRCLSSLLLLLSGILAASHCRSGPEVVVHPAGEQSVRVSVEVASSAPARARGLMYRRDLPADAGMLFVFSSAREQSFWMKNTPLSLDIVFIGEDHAIVGIAENTVPFSRAPIRVRGASRYVLEVNAGFAARHHIKPGDRVDLPRIAGAE